MITINNVDSNIKAYETGSVFEPCIPKSDNAYIERNVIEVVNQAPINVDYKIPSKPTADHELRMWNTINKFEQDSWNPDNKGLDSGFKKINMAFGGGIKPGFVIIGGDSNIGKSAIMSQMAYQVANLNKDAYVMDFSLDDPMNDKLPRIIGSGNKVLLNAVRNPADYKHLPLMLGRRKAALNRLRFMVDRYTAYDSNDTSFVEDIEEKVKETQIMFDANGIKKKIVVFIDNFHDLNIKNRPDLVDKQKFDTLAQWGADLAIKYNIAVICTAELKKLNASRRPALDDIREAVKIKYEAKAVILVYNEVHYKGEGSEIFFNRANNNIKQPVMELHFAKNKISGFKGRLFYEFYPEMARIEEVDDLTTKKYNSIIFKA